MPGMSGIDLLVEVHRHYPHMPVLILTAHAALESAIQAVRLGARDYLIKPVEPVLILTRVAEILAESEQPARKKEIVSQMQSLLAELQKIEGEDATPTSALAALPPADPARFLKKGNFDLDLHARHATLNGKYIPVTGIYFDYLCTLLRHAPKAVAYKTLVKESQGYDVDDRGGQRPGSLANPRITQDDRGGSSAPPIHSDCARHRLSPGDLK